MAKQLTDTEALLDDEPTLRDLRQMEPSRRRVRFSGTTLGERVADRVAIIVGSWTFIIIQSLLLVLWIVLNLVAWFSAWDPYPFILLNLVLSFQAAFTAPIIMMSQNRQSAVDRMKAELDYHVNVKAELEIEELHQKIDLLREQEVKQLIGIVETLVKRLDDRDKT
jgi:uncharacterized membrane protein